MCVCMRVCACIYIKINRCRYNLISVYMLMFLLLMFLLMLFLLLLLLMLGPDLQNVVISVPVSILGIWGW